MKNFYYFIIFISLVISLGCGGGGTTTGIPRNSHTSGGKHKPPRNHPGSMKAKVGKLHGASIFMYTKVYQGKRSILLIKRGMTDRNLNTKTWAIPGGHVDPGENFFQAATREAYEETFKVYGYNHVNKRSASKPIKPWHIYKSKYVSLDGQARGDRHVTYFKEVPFVQGSILWQKRRNGSATQKREVKDLKWVPLDKFKQGMQAAWNQEYAYNWRNIPVKITWVDGNGHTKTITLFSYFVRAMLSNKAKNIINSI